jgi:hypothetical protein
MELNFGIVGTEEVERKVAAAAPFRLAVLGDFSAAANKGRLETGDDLARRKPLRVDVDNIDDMIARLDITLSLPMAEGTVEFPIAAMDDFHPDQIYEKVELFSAMSDLRRRVTSKSGFPVAAKEIAAWRNEPAPALPPVVPPRPRGATVPLGGKLSDFAALVGKPSAPQGAAEVAVESLIKSVVRPYIIKAQNPQQPALLAWLDEALAVTMRNVLHHPDFQALESLWRSVDLLTRRLETSTQLQIVLYDISAEEFAADLAVTDTLEDSGLYKLLVENPALDANQGALSVVIGAYVFDQTPPQAELLGRMAKLADRAKAPFISSISPVFLETKPEDVHPLIKEAWEGLRALDEASYLGLVTPRYLLRQPYGERTDPIAAFEGFEEFTRRIGLKGMLWGNPAFIAGLMLAQTFAKQGPKMTPGDILTAGDMPYYFYVDDDDDQTALPCTERLMNERVVARVSSEHLIPLLSLKGRPEVRLGGFTSLAGSKIAGRWTLPAAAPEAKPKEKDKDKKKKAKAKPAEDVTEAERKATADAAAESGDEATESTEALPEAEKTGDADLDKLLASLKEGTETAGADGAAEGEVEMDPDLAKLLKE